MLNFFQYIINFFNMVWTFIGNTFSTIRVAIAVIVSSLESTMLAIGYMPAIISIAFTVTILIFLVNWILGRN